MLSQQTKPIRWVFYPRSAAHLHPMDYAYGLHRRSQMGVHVYCTPRARI